MDEFIESYCSCETSSKASHIIEQHVTDILCNTLQPVFKKQVSIHPNLSKRLPSRYGSKNLDIHEDQQWKNGFYVELLLWLLENLSVGALPGTQQLQDNLQLIIPPVLIILDDYDVEYKEKGVDLLQMTIHKLEPQYISKFGLDNVFLEDRDIPLLRATYPCILLLIATKKQEQARFNLFERVLKDGILTGFRYAGQKIKFLPILLKPIPTLYNELGSFGVQYLKALMPALCAAMSMTSSHNPIIKEINQLAATSLIAIIKKCWPCIPSYRGLIMQSMAKTWTCYFAAKGKYTALHYFYLELTCGTYIQMKPCAKH
ncbi:hypothetical protein [Parasitella parasitica]|uniref:Uncharacterized protein n=1 Tax=Parasitella parasitica TaxID=35722 RepID=A0A0B7N716_9FUNG|nr:hypothetical protein [Parasitella parasitica]